MTDYFTPTVFVRHNRFIHTLMIESQAWFCVQDLGRMMGRSLDERMARKLDSDQFRYVWLQHSGTVKETLMVSESSGQEGVV